MSYAEYKEQQAKISKTTMEYQVKTFGLEGPCITTDEEYIPLFRKWTPADRLIALWAYNDTCYCECCGVGFKKDGHDYCVDCRPIFEK